MVVSSGVVAPVQRVVDRLHQELTPLSDGHVATYIPELAKANPDWFGISLIMLDGREYASGDVDVPFTIQSIAKPFMYGLALERVGAEDVLAKVGLEPTGDAFNAISVHPVSGTPSNPMINAGAIATTGIVLEAVTDDPLTRVLEMLSRYVGREVQIDQAVYTSERDTGHRNRAISHLLRGFEIIGGNPEAALDLYFQQCSANVTCRDLAFMAATLANGGVHPITGERALASRYVESVLSVMSSCGMYDFAGEWTYRVGMPAKSGVGGGLLAVLPGQFGLGVFSPLLDARGNSVRGLAVCDALSRTFSLHMLSVPNMARSAIRATYDATAVRSKRVRPGELGAALASLGRRIRVYELQADLAFASAEAFSRDAASRADTFDYLVVDFRLVDQIGAGALVVLSDLFAVLLDAGKQIALSEVAQPQRFAAQLAALAADSADLIVCPDRDRALEWCEDRLLEAERGTAQHGQEVPLAENELCQGLSKSGLDLLSSIVTWARAAAGERIITAGERGTSVLLLTRGDVSVTFDLGNRKNVRAATLSAGMCVGEMSLLGETGRTADVVADTDVEYCELQLIDFHRLQTTAPEVRMVLLENLARKLASHLRQTNAELRALAGQSTTGQPAPAGSPLDSAAGGLDVS
jgi:glutaminase